MKAGKPRGALPLLAWGDTRRDYRQRRLHHLRLAILGGAGLVLLAAPPIYSPAPRLVWNASASAPIGLYWVWPGSTVARGDMVVARVPEPWRTLAARRRYLPANVPLVKRVAAARGALVCASGARILIDGEFAAMRLARDASGRRLPRWDGCRRLRQGEVLLLMDAPGSFDGRYFGISRAHDLVGRARLIWRR